ncbi:MAG: alternative ribosome rescue aminoacyl-tRNA hydrolase ArfB [Leeuwenhoekiella sp.]
MNRDLLLRECDFKAVRSGGAGGQHVNKTSTKVVLTWNLEASVEFDEPQKQQLRDRLSNKLSRAGDLILTNDSSRSQHSNKDAVIKQFFAELERGLFRRKARRKTRPSKMAKLKRLKAKKQQSDKKANRKPPEF